MGPSLQQGDGSDSGGGGGGGDGRAKAHAMSPLRVNRSRPGRSGGVSAFLRIATACARCSAPSLATRPPRLLPPFRLIEEVPGEQWSKRERHMHAKCSATAAVPAKSA